jgi:hypothetical protein
MLEYSQDSHGRIVAVHSPITYPVDVGEEAAKAAEIARKLKMRKKSILTSINSTGSKARRRLCYRERMRISSKYPDASTYIGLC